MSEYTPKVLKEKMRRLGGHLVDISEAERYVMMADYGTRCADAWAALEKRLAAAEAMADKVIAEVEGDERYHYPAADVWVNAPLALIQCVMKGQLMAAKRIQAAARAKEKER